jgi:hypothetical protein
MDKGPAQRPAFLALTRTECPHLAISVRRFACPHFLTEGGERGLTLATQCGAGGGPLLSRQTKLQRGELSPKASHDVFLTRPTDGVEMARDPGAQNRALIGMRL